MKYTGKWWDSKHRTEPEREFTYGVVKILYVIIVVIAILFFLTGCEKFEMESNPQLNLNGRWDVVEVDVVIDKVNYNSEVIVLDDDRAAVSNFFVTGVTENNELLLSQDFENTIINKRFDESTTQWEFDYNSLRVSDDISDETMNVWFPCTYCTESTIIETDYRGSKTRYTFSIDTYGAMPSNVLKLTSQVFYTNILIGGNQYDKAIESHLEITLHRF
jgi:hypothetical protein